ncbi:MAG: B12-binding domain-containing radical SAM protein [Nanoarchaeota archaeon]|nr:B12-binding domain-containing radical SAM protein [Nanoarchaeota archaeon]
MKVLLVKVPSDMHVILPPIGLGYLAAYLKNKVKNINIAILDCLKEKYDHKKFSEYIKETRPNVVGMTAFTMEIESAIKCCEEIKNIDKNIITIIGGPHASNDAEHVLCNENVDFIFKGEAELGFYELIESLKNKKSFSKVANLGYKEKGKMKFNEMRFIDNLDEISYPDYELMKFSEYPKMYFMKKYPSAPILTSRGCPFSCTFCSAGKLSGKKFRYRTPKNIIEEIRFLKEKYHIKEFEIWDDNFSMNKERAMEFCNLLIKENINLEWWCPNGLRIETLDEELLKRMKESGCYAMAVGIESGSEKIQKDMKKFLNFDKVREIVNLAHKIGIRTQGFFIIGYPTETKEDILKTIKFAKELPLDRASFSLFQPLVGSDIYECLEKEGKLKDINLNKCEYSKPSILPEGFNDIKEVKKLQKKAILEFYLRPKVLSKFIIENLTIDQLKEIGSMFKKYILNK